MREFGDLLRELRIQQGYSRQYAAAKACRLSASYWSKLENWSASAPSGHKMRPPGVEIIDQIAKGLKLSEGEQAELLRASGQDLPVAHLEPIRALLQVLRDDLLRQDTEELLKSDIQNVVRCWQLYAEAKENQYERNWEKAAVLSEQAHTQASQLANRLKAYVLDTRAAVLLHQNKLDNVATLHQQVATIAPTLGDDYVVALNAMHQGDYSRVCDHWDAALQHYIAAHERFSRLPNRRREMARCQRKIASVYLHQGDWVRAQSELDSAFSTCRELYEASPQEGEYELARTAYVLGWACNLAGAWEEAHQFHMRGYEIATDFKTKREKTDEYLLMQGHSYLATDERQLGNFTSAESHYLQAESICIEHGYTREKAWIYLGLARLYANQTSTNGENWGDRQKAEQYFARAQKEAGQMGSKYQLAMVLNHAAHMHLNESTKTGNQKALDLLNQADRLARELGAAYYIAAIQRQMAEIYLRRGDFDRIALVVGEVEELHRRYHYHNHMAWLRVIEAKAILQQSAIAADHALPWTDVARFYAYALMHGLKFNSFWADQILEDFTRAIAPLAASVQADLRRKVADQLKRHEEIRAYEQDVIQRRTTLLKALNAPA